MAATLKKTLLVETASRLVGCIVISGAVMTRSSASELNVMPATLVTRTE